MNISVKLTPKTNLEKALKKVGIEDPAIITSLAIVGRMTKSDVAYFSENMGKTLQELDLSRVSFKKNIIFEDFKNCTGLTSVILPDSIEKIGFYSFSGCTGLTSIIIPDSVVKICSSAFDGCTGLTSVVLPASFVEFDSFFGIRTFCGCTGLTSIEIHPDNPAFASHDGVLLNKERTELIFLPKGRQGDYIIPDSVKRIEKYAFESCVGITSITASNTHPEYSSDDGVLFNKDKTELILYPKGRQGDYVIPDSVTKIRDYAFSGCSGLTSVIIPDSTRSTGECVFLRCTGLSSIFISASVVDFGTSDNNIKYEENKTTKEACSLYHCNCLTSIAVAPNNPVYASENGVLFNKDKTELLVYPKGRQGDYVVPQSVVKIRAEAFWNTSGLTSIVIPTSVKEIENRAFRDCTALKSVTIPNSVTNIEEQTLYGCSGLTSVVIPDTVTKIGCCAFADCTGLTSIDIPDSVVEIVRCAFWNCAELTSIFIPASVVRIVMWIDDTIGLDGIVDFSCRAYITVHPDNPVYASKDGKLVVGTKPASGTIGELEWTYSEGVLTISGEGEMPDYDYDDCRPPWFLFSEQITKIVFKGNIKKKGKNAFFWCDNISSVTFENNSTTHFSKDFLKDKSIIDRVLKNQGNR